MRDYACSRCAPLGDFDGARTEPFCQERSSKLVDAVLFCGDLVLAMASTLHQDATPAPRTDATSSCLSSPVVSAPQRRVTAAEGSFSKKAAANSSRTKWSPSVRAPCRTGEGVSRTMGTRTPHCL